MGKMAHGVILLLYTSLRLFLACYLSLKIHRIMLVEKLFSHLYYHEFAC